jgi:DNA-binding CsgD family transcriptional regulator
MGKGALSEAEFAVLENAIYEAAIIPEKWVDVLQKISDVGEGRGAVMFSVTQWKTQWESSPGIRPAMIEFINGGWAARNTRMVNGMRKGLHFNPKFHTEADLYDPGERETDPFYLDFCLPHDMGASAGSVVHLPEGDMINFSVEKAIVDGPMTASALARLDSLRPHLARSAMLTARLGFEYVRTAVETLAQLGFAAAAVGGQGKVLVANELFQVESAPWTTRLEDRIALKDKAAALLLQTTLETIAGSGGVRSIALREQDMPVRHVLHVIPVRRLARDIFTNAVAILVISTANEKVGSASLLQVLFDLTPAEANLARQIGMGRSIDNIAAQDNRSKFTLRTQLKTVLNKTGCSRQSDLAHVLTSLLSPQQSK